MSASAVKTTVLPLPLPEALCEASGSQLARWTVETAVVVVLVVVVCVGC